MPECPVGGAGVAVSRAEVSGKGAGVAVSNAGVVCSGAGASSSGCRTRQRVREAEREVAPECREVGGDEAGAGEDGLEAASDRSAMESKRLRGSKVLRSDEA
jgi:hypothetical protein